MKKFLIPCCFLVLLSTGCSLMDYTLVNPYDQFERNGLPVFYLHPKPISKDYYSPVTVIYKGETYEAEGKIRGGQTALYPKKSYTLKFSDDKLFTDRDNSDFSERKKIVLIANLDDNSHMRNRLAYFFWNQLDNPFKIRSSSAEIFTNGSYEGLYTFAEFIDETFIERNNSSGNGVPTGGDLFKGTLNDAKFRIKDDILAGYEKKAGYPEEGDDGAFDTLEDFIININNLSDSEVSEYFTDSVEVQSYYDWWFLVSFLQGWDSIGKNSYHYLPPGDGQKWHYIPWDFNQSYGQSWDTTRLESEFNPDNFSFNGILERLIQHSDFKPTYDARYSSLLAGNLQLATILAEVDRINNEIRAAALADEEKWNDTYRGFRVWDERDDYTTYDEEIQYIKEWITDQHDLFEAYY